MKITNHRKVYDSEYRYKLEKFAELSSYQVGKVLDFFDNEEYDIVVYEGKNRSSSGLWRLTIPFYFLYHVIHILLVIPIKWLFTGSAYFKMESRFMKVYKYWTKRLNF